MTVKVLFFGQLREIVGQSEQSAEVRAGAPIEELFGEFGGKYPRLKEFRASLVASRNREFAAWDEQMEPGDEIAFLPPVSGG